MLTKISKKNSITLLGGSKKNRASCNRAASRCKFIPNVHWAGYTAAGLLVVAQEVHTSEDCVRKERPMISSYLHRRRWHRRRGKNANEGNELAAVDGA